MLTCLSCSECKVYSLSVIYINLTNILTYVETYITTWCYSSTYTKDTIAKDTVFHDKYNN